MSARKLLNIAYAFAVTNLDPDELDKHLGWKDAFSASAAEIKERDARAPKIQSAPKSEDKQATIKLGRKPVEGQRGMTREQAIEAGLISE